MECAESRLNYISDLSDFIKNHSKKIQGFCDELGWTVQQTTQNSKNLSECPLDPSHLVSQEKLDNHIERCQLNQQGYSKNDVLFPSNFENGGPTITLSSMDQVAIIQVAAATDPSIPTVSLASAPEVPQSSSRLLSSFTARQRLALYEHAVKETSSDTTPAFRFTELDLSFENNDAKTQEAKSILDIQREQRDAKRRRLNYRQAKKVHTQHKSLMEITREVIDNQMEMYTEWVKQTELDSTRSEKPSRIASPSNSQQEKRSREKDRKNSYHGQRRNDFDSEHMRNNHEKASSSRYKDSDHSRSKYPERSRNSDYGRVRRDKDTDATYKSRYYESGDSRQHSHKHKNDRRYSQDSKYEDDNHRYTEDNEVRSHTERKSHKHAKHKHPKERSHHSSRSERTLSRK